MANTNTTTRKRNNAKTYANNNSSTNYAAITCPFKVKATKASSKDGSKFTFSAAELGVPQELIASGVNLVVAFKGTGKTTHNVVLTASRNGKTFYGDCPRALKMPAVGKPAYYTAVEVGFMVGYE